MKNNLTSKIFLTEGAFQKIYNERLEHQPQVSKAVKDSYKNPGYALDEYLNATQEHMFRYAYQCGYEAATVKM